MNLKLYIVVNKEGKYFRAKGYGGHGESWIDDIQRARIYTRLGPARSIVSFFASEYPTYGIPDIHELKITSSTVLDEKKRVEKTIKKKAEAKAKSEERWAEYRLKQAEEEARKAQERLEQLKAGKK